MYLKVQHVSIDSASSTNHSVQVGDVEDVYEVVNEDQYSEIVRQRQEDDWVVDDGTAGMQNVHLLLMGNGWKQLK